MKVLLISANRVTSPFPVYPLGLDYVAAALRPRHQVRIIDVNALDGSNTLHGALVQYQPDIVGLSLRNIDNTDTTRPRGFMGDYQEIVATIRNTSTAPIVLGGAGFSLFPHEILSALQADYGIIGEGERMAGLLDALERGESVDSLTGVITIHGSESFPPPLPDITPRRLATESQHIEFYLKNGGMLNLQTKRGCPFHCIYCTYPHIEGRRFRLIDPEAVAQTALDLQRAGAKYLFFTDSAFNADIQHSLDVAQALIQAGLGIPWGAFMAPIEMPTDFFKVMAQAGLTHVEFGTESLSNQVLKSYGKPYERSQIIAAHQAALKAGLHTAHYFLLGGPGETAQTLETTLTEIDKLNRAVHFFYCGIRIYPNTALFDVAVRQGQIEPNQDLLTPVYYQSPAIGSDEIVQRVKSKGGDRINWVIGDGGDEAADLLTRLHDRGYTGPLWEYLIR